MPYPRPNFAIIPAHATNRGGHNSNRMEGLCLHTTEGGNAGAYFARIHTPDEGRSSSNWGLENTLTNNAPYLAEYVPGNEVAYAQGLTTSEIQALLSGRYTVRQELHRLVSSNAAFNLNPYHYLGSIEITGFARNRVLTPFEIDLLAEWMAWVWDAWIAPYANITGAPRLPDIAAVFGHFEIAPWNRSDPGKYVWGAVPTIIGKAKLLLSPPIVVTPPKVDYEKLYREEIAGLRRRVEDDQKELEKIDAAIIDLEEVVARASEEIRALGNHASSLGVRMELHLEDIAKKEAQLSAVPQPSAASREADGVTDQPVEGGSDTP